MVAAVNPQPEDPHIRIVHSIYREMIRRKFTARQRSIIDFILTLSWGCGKPSAIIPKMQDFRQCGVGPNHIRKELKGLSEANVILWESSMNAYQLYKHFDHWRIDEVEDSDRKQMDKLIRLNLENRSPNLSKTLPKKGSSFPKEEDGKLPERGSDFPKGEEEELPNPGSNSPNGEAKTSRKGKFKLPKKGSQMFKLSRHIKRFRPSKESIKAIIKKRKKNDDDIGQQPSLKYESFYSAHTRLFGKEMPPFQFQKFAAFIDEDKVEEELIIHALERMKKKADRYSLNFALTTLGNYVDAGALTVELAKQIDDKFDATKSSNTAGGRSGKPKIEMVSEQPKSQTVSPEELEELRKLARKLDGNHAPAI